MTISEADAIEQVRQDPLALARFWMKVQPQFSGTKRVATSRGCWLWVGQIQYQGYGGVVREGSAPGTTPRGLCPAPRIDPRRAGPRPHVLYQSVREPRSPRACHAEGQCAKGHPAPNPAEGMCDLLPQGPSTPCRERSPTRGDKGPGMLGLHAHLQPRAVARSALAGLRGESGMTAPTLRQLAALDSLITCGTQKEAAAQLGISIQTMKNHLYALRRSQDMTTLQLVAWRTLRKAA